MRVDSIEGTEVTRELVLHTDTGTLPSGGKDMPLKVDNNGIADVQVWLGDLVTPPEWPSRIWVTAGERTLASTEVTLLIPTALQILQSSAVAEIGGGRGVIRALVTDQYGNPLRDTASILRYVLPGEKPRAIAAVSDGDGVLLYHLPAGTKEGVAYFQIFVEKLVSEQLAIEYVRAGQTNHNSLVATISLPSSVNLAVTDTVPVLIAVDALGDEQVPDTVMVCVNDTGCSFVGSGKAVQEVALVDGVGMAELRVSQADPQARRLSVAAFVAKEGGEQKLPQYIGAADLWRQSASRVTAVVKPTIGPGVLSIAVRDSGGGALVNTPVVVCYTLPDGSTMRETHTTNGYGNVALPLPQHEGGWSEQVQVACGEHNLAPLHIGFDKSGRATGWSAASGERGAIYREQFLYNPDGTVEVKHVVK